MVGAPLPYYKVGLILLPDFNAPQSHLLHRLPPAGPAVVAAVARELNMDVVVEDLAFSLLHQGSRFRGILDDWKKLESHLRSLEDEQVACAVSALVGRIASSGWDGAAISTERSSQAVLALLAAREIKLRTGIPVIIGGAAAGTCKEVANLANLRGVDLISRARTQAEIRVALQELRRAPPGRNSLFFEPLGASQEQSALEPRLEPDYDAFDLSLYRKDPFSAEPGRFAGYDGCGQEILVLTFQLSTACQFRCAFCQSEGKQTVPALRESISTLKALSERYHTRHFFFTDTQMNLFAEEFCRELINAGVDLRWTNSLRVSPVKKSTLKLMVDAGCIGLTIGVESGSDRVLRRMRKGHTVRQASWLVAEANALGIYSRVNMLTCFPGETAEDHGSSCDWVREHALMIDDLAPSAFYLAPSSPIAESPFKFGVRLRGRRDLKGDLLFRKIDGAMSYDEIEGYTWEEREPLLKRSEIELRQAWDPLTSGRATGGQITSSMMFAMHDLSLTKESAYSMLKNWRVESRKSESIPAPSQSVPQRPSRQADLCSLELAVRDAALVETDRSLLGSLEQEFGAVRVILDRVVRDGCDARLRVSPSETARVFTLVSRRVDLPSESLLQVLWENGTIEGEDLDREGMLGTLLGYPDCCIERFRAINRDSGISRSNLQQAVQALRSTVGSPPQSMLNWLFQDHFSLVAHRPCSFSCPESLKIAQRFVSALRRGYPGFVRELLRDLATHVVYFDSEEYLAFRGTVFRIREGSFVGRVESIARMRNRQGRWSSLFELLEPGSQFMFDNGLFRKSGSSSHFRARWETDFILVSFSPS